MSWPGLLQAQLDQCSHSGAVTGRETLEGCRHHLLTRHSAPIDLETYLGRQFSNDLALSATVAVPEWMDGIYLSHVVAAAHRERLGIRAFQIGICGQLSQHALQTPVRRTQRLRKDGRPSRY